MTNPPFYHGNVKKVITAFGALFSDIHIDRKEDDSVLGNTVQRLHIPITYAPRDKTLVRVEQDPTLNKHTYVSLPRMSFEITGYMYDADRKLNKNQKIQCITPDGSSEMYTPVPYNIEISLYILTKNQEDALQIVEQILPSFGPEYMLSILAVPEMNIVQDIPITLTSVSVSDDYEGDMEMRRFVTHTLTFTVKMNMYGAIMSGKRIYEVNANITDSTSKSTFNAKGDPETHLIISEGWLEGL